MKKKRWGNNDSTDSNRFDLLEYMKRKTLTLVMRNSIQVYDLFEITKKTLESVATRHNLQEKKRKDVQEEKYSQNDEEKNKNKSEEVTITKKSVTEILGDSAQFSGSNLELDEGLDYTKAPEAHEADKSNITSRFEYKEAADIGHR